MIRYVQRRLVQAVFTVFGVMLLTFVLFRVIAGDVSAAPSSVSFGGPGGLRVSRPISLKHSASIAAPVKRR